MQDSTTKKRETTMADSVFVIASMAVILIAGSYFKLRYELLMVAAAVVAALVAMCRLGYRWEELEDSISGKMKSVTPTLFLIWCTGLLIAALIFSGSVPMLIYYGFKIIDPQYIYVSSFFLCLVMSMATGSSWSSAGTAGLAMYGMAVGMHASVPITVGAIIAGSIFGDKMSPLSETTNMAPACAGTDIYSHIRSMLWTTLPPTLIAIVVYIIAGMQMQLDSQATAQSVGKLMEELDKVYHFNIILLLPFAIIIYAAVTKKPVIPLMTVTIISAILLGFFYQGFSLERGMYAAINGFKVADIAPGFKGSANLVKLLERGGAKSMAGTVIMCYSGFACAAIIAKAQFLEVFLRSATQKIDNRVKAMAAALGTNIFIMLATGTAYVAFIMVSEMYRKIFIKNNIGIPALSRSLEDIGTCLGCLIPWSLSGAYYASLFGVPIYGDGGYALWTVLPYVTPVVAMFWAATGIGMYKLNEEEKQAKLLELDRVVAS